MPQKNQARKCGQAASVGRRILALVDQPFRSSSQSLRSASGHTSPLCRRTTDRAHAADLHACAEPFYDSAWLSNSSSPSLSAGEWDKTPLPAHSPICRCSGMCNIRSPFSTWTRPGHRRTRVGAEEAIIPWPLLSVGTSEPVSTQAADTNINPNATMNAMRIQASPRPCTGSGWRWWHRSISRAALIVLVGVPPT